MDKACLHVLRRESLRAYKMMPFNLRVVYEPEDFYQDAYILYRRIKKRYCKETGHELAAFYSRCLRNYFIDFLRTTTYAQKLTDLPENDSLIADDVTEEQRLESLNWTETMVFQLSPEACQALARLFNHARLRQGEMELLRREIGDDARSFCFHVRRSGATFRDLQFCDPEAV